MKEHDYTIDDSTATEYEVREFIRGLVLVQKPHLVVETGCYLGGATRSILAGLSLNRRGRLVTCDTDAARCQVVANDWRVMRPPVEVRHCRGVDLPELREADLVFLDSDYRERRAEFALVKPGAMVVVHDTRISYDSEVPPHEEWVRDAGGILFDTYRGFALVRKRL